MNSKKMNAVQMWICLVFVFCSAQSQGYDCKWMTSQYGIVNGEALSLLRQMGGTFSSEIVPFPERIYKKMENGTDADQLRFMAEVTEQIVKLFDDDYAAARWDTRALDNFLNILQTRQLKELESCATAYPNTRRRPLKVRKHFRELRQMLRKNNYSRESWEKIRRAVLLHLTRMGIMAGHV